MSERHGGSISKRRTGEKSEFLDETPEDSVESPEFLDDEFEEDIDDDEES